MKNTINLIINHGLIRYDLIFTPFFITIPYLRFLLMNEIIKNLLL